MEKPSERQLGKYELIRRLAKGGMAEIFLAKTQGIANFEKLVVLKRILPEHAVDRRFIEMFLQEARLAATLHHTNIAQVYDIGRSDSTYFFTMEYIRGTDLRRVEKIMAQADRIMPLEHAITIALGVMAGVHYAHEKRLPNGELVGIVHRDISPSNVLVGFDGAVKVVDFGIAKATSLRGETQLQGIKGKIPYMSPEQCQNRPLDRRSDIFAIGILLYELTTGRHLYNEESDFELMRKIVDEDVVPPSTHVPGYPPELERIVLRTLRRDKNERYSTAEALQLDVEQFVQSSKLLVSTAALGRFVRGLVGEQGHEEASFREEAALLEVAPIDLVTLSLPGLGDGGGHEGVPGELAPKSLDDATAVVDVMKPMTAAESIESGRLETDRREANRREAELIEGYRLEGPVALPSWRGASSFTRARRRRWIALAAGGLMLALSVLLVQGWRSHDTASTEPPVPMTRVDISASPVAEPPTSQGGGTLVEAPPARVEAPAARVEAPAARLEPAPAFEDTAPSGKSGRVGQGRNRTHTSRKSAYKQAPRKNTHPPAKAGAMPNDRNSFYLPD